MKRFLSILLVACLALTVTGCATTSYMSVANSASISQANFHIVGPIQREYTATYILIFGGGSKKAALEHAIADMTRQLKPNQALAYINVVESSKIPIIPIIHTQTTHISATIIEYDR